MIEELCHCDNLPYHSHWMGIRPDERGVWVPWWDPTDVGRVSVDWKAVARALITEAKAA